MAETTPKENVGTENHANPKISQVKLGTTVYDIHDKALATYVESVVASLSRYTDFLGVMVYSEVKRAYETPVYDGATTATVKTSKYADGVVANEGDIVIQGSDEFIYDGTKWNLFGNLSNLGLLSKKDSVAGSTNDVQVTGEVSQPTFTGSDISYTPAGGVTVNNGKTGITVGSTLSNAATVAKGSVSVSSSAVTTGKTANYTPSGTINQPTFTGENIAYTPSGTINQPTFTGNDISYTPVGTIGTQKFSGTKVTGLASKVTSWDAGGASTWSFSVSNEILTIGGGNGTKPSLGYSSVDYQPAGTVDKAAFTGTSATFKPTGEISVPEFTGAAVAFKPVGTVSKPVFAGTGAIISAAFTGEQSVVSGTVTSTVTDNGHTHSGGFSGTKATLKPSGTVSKPVFTGGSHSHTVTAS